MSVLGESRVLAFSHGRGSWRGTAVACGWRGGRRASREARRRACSRRHSSLTPGRPMWLSERSSDVIVELEARTCHISHPVVEPRAVAGAQRGGSREGGGLAWPGVTAVRGRGGQAGHLRHGVDALVAKPIVTQIQRPDLRVGQQRCSKCTCSFDTHAVMAQVNVLALELRDEHSNGNDLELGALGQVLLLSRTGRVIHQIHLHQLCDLRLAVEVALPAVLALPLLLALLLLLALAGLAGLAHRA